MISKHSSFRIHMSNLTECELWPSVFFMSLREISQGRMWKTTNNFSMQSFSSSPAKEGSRWGEPLQMCGWADQDWESYCCTNTDWATLLKHRWAQQNNTDINFLMHQLPRLSFHILCCTRAGQHIDILLLTTRSPQLLTIVYLALIRPCSTPQAISLTALVISYLDV